MIYDIEVLLDLYRKEEVELNEEIELFSRAISELDPNDPVKEILLESLHKRQQRLGAIKSIL